jgi:hypothetical protein
MRLRKARERIVDSFVRRLAYREDVARGYQ